MAKTKHEQEAEKLQEEQHIAQSKANQKTSGWASSSGWGAGGNKAK
jgi:hypothetical protein